MGAACSPVIANLFIGRFEQQALSSVINPPKIWLRYVDDTFLILKKDQVDDFTSQIACYSLKSSWPHSFSHSLSLQYIFV